MSLFKYLGFGMLLVSGKAMASSCFFFSLCIPNFAEPEYKQVRRRDRSVELQKVSKEEPVSISPESSITSEISLHDLWDEDDPLELFCDISDTEEPKKVKWTDETRALDGPSKPLSRIRKSMVSKDYIKARMDMKIYEIIISRIGRETAKQLLSNKSSSGVLATLFINRIINRNEMYHIIELNVDMEASPFW